MYNLKDVVFEVTGNIIFSSNEIQTLDETLSRMIRIFNYYWEDYPVNKYIFRQTPQKKLQLIIDGFNLITNVYEQFATEDIDGDFDDDFPYKEVQLLIDECDDYFLGTFNLNKIA